MRIGRGDILFTLGMTAYWPFFIHALFSPVLFVGSAPVWGSAYYAVMLLAMAACLGVSVHRAREGGAGVAEGGEGLRANRADAERRIASIPLAGATTVACALLAALLAGSALGVSWLTGAVLPGACAVCLGVLVTLLTTRWARAALVMEPARLAVCLSASVVAAQVVNAGAITLGEALGLPDAAWSCVFPVLSAVLGMFLPPSPAAPAEPRGRAVGADWLVMLGVLALYLLGSGIFRSAYKAQTGEAQAVFALVWRLVVVAVSLAILAYAARSLRTAGREPYPWAVFAFACLAILYFVLLARGYLGEACNVIVLHSRLVAVFLMWAAAERFARLRGGARAPLAMAGVFLLAQTLVRWLTSLPTDEFWGTPFADAFLEAVLVLTAFAMTVGVFWWVRAQGAVGRVAKEEASLPAEPRDGIEVAAAALHAELALTDREADVLRLIARGHTQKAIADELGVSFNSVRTYAKGLYLKLGVHSRQEVIDLVAKRAE